MKIEFCCDALRSAFKSESFILEDDSGVIAHVPNPLSISFCPFCGAEIKVITKKKRSVR